jgi:hypothetical protein
MICVYFFLSSRGGAIIVSREHSFPSEPRLACRLFRRPARQAAIRVLPYGRQSGPKADRLSEVRIGAVGQTAEPVLAQLIGDGNFGARRSFRAYRQRCRCYPSWPGRRMIGSAEEFFPVESGRRIVHNSPLEGTCMDALRGSRAFFGLGLSCRLRVCVRPHMRALPSSYFFIVGSLKRERGGAVRFSPRRSSRYGRAFPCKPHIRREDVPTTVLYSTNDRGQPELELADCLIESVPAHPPVSQRRGHRSGARTLIGPFGG